MMQKEIVKKLKIQLEDPSVDVINTTLSQRSTHVSENNQMKVFLLVKLEIKYKRL